MANVLKSSTTYRTTPLSSRRVAWYYTTKRVLDFFLSIALIMLFAPVMIIVALLIKFDSRGPILFHQKRIGARLVQENHRWTWKIEEFECLKFRTMFHNTDPSLHKTYITALIKNDQGKMEELQAGKQAIRKLVNDPRITRVGHVLRKYSLDELPQFFNVLAGSMSLVGPRPAIGYEVELYSSWHKQRLNAKPGLTGLQQVMARCTVDFDEQVKFDLEYIEKQSIWLDLKIMILTPFAVLKHQGAC